MKADKLWEAVDQRIEMIKQAQQISERGSEAARILALPAIDAHFKQKFRDCITQMLSCDDSELIRWRANAASLIDFYTSLVSAVSAGEVSARRLSEMQAQDKQSTSN